MALMAGAVVQQSEVVRWGQDDVLVDEVDHLGFVAFNSPKRNVERAMPLALQA